MFEPLDERLVPDVRRWQAPRLGDGAAPGTGPGAETNPFADAGVPGGEAAPEAEARAAAEAAALRSRFEEGHARGLAEGQAAANARVHGEAAALVAALVREHARRDAHLEEELVALARSMVRLILRRELDDDAGVLRDLVRGALEGLPAATEAPAVVLHPDDLAAVAPLLSPAEAERLVPDPALARGDCRVELGASVIDAGIDAWVARVAADVGPVAAPVAG